MRDTLLLFRVLYKSSSTFSSEMSPRKEKLLKAGLVLFLLVCFIPYGVMMYFQIDAGMTLLTLQLVSFFVLLINLIQILYQLPTTLYFSQDNRMLFPLPVSSGQIVLAQTMVAAVNSLLIGAFGAALFVIPCIIAGAGNPVGWILAVLGFLLAPLSELLLVGVLVVIGMRFLPFFRNKDRFMLIFGTIGLVGGLMIAFSSMQAGQNASMQDNMEAMMLFDPALISMGSNVFFQTNFLVDMAFGHPLTGTLCMLACVILPGVLYFALAELLYLPAAMSVSASSSSRKKTKIRLVHDPLWKAFMKNDLRLLLRSPAYLLNCVLSSFVMPVVFTIMMLIDSSKQELMDALAGFDVMTIDNIGVWALFLGMALGLFSGGMNLTASSVITREGRTGVNWMKSIPVSVTQQVRYKTILAFLIQYVASLLYIVLFHLFLSYPVWLDLLFAFGLLVTIVPFTQLSVWVDVLMPKLDWTNETMAIKNNMNSVVEIFGGILIAMIAAGLAFVFREHIAILAVVLVLFFLALIPLFDRAIDKACRTKLAMKTRKSRSFGLKKSA